MAQPSRKRATYADVLAAPENFVAEVIDGELSLSPRPASRHARVFSRLGSALDGPFDRGRGGPGGWILLDEPELHLGSEPDILVPDLGGWRRERMPKIPDTAFFTLPPDWICEVLSPRTARRDRVGKLPIYLREGVIHAWLIDPVARTLELFRSAGETWRLVATYGGDAVVRAEPFDAIELELAALWADIDDGSQDAG